MNEYLIYLVKASLVMAMFYIPYALFWRNTTFFNLNRIYLLGALISSIIFPALTVRINSGVELKPISLLLEPITVKASGTITEEQSMPVIRILGILYISGTLTFILILFYRFVKIFMLIKKEGISNKNGYKTVKMKEMHSPASFFHLIFISEKDDNEEIYAHENVHIQQGHSFDILFIAFLKAMFWFNPVIWLYENSVKNLHEFLADAGTLQRGYNKVNYQRLMVEKTFGVQLTPLATNFNYSPLKKRLKMITKHKSNKQIKWLYLMSLPLFVASFLLIACEQTNQSEKIIPEKPTFDPSNDEVIEETTVDDVFSIVEEMPTFNGGDVKNFSKYIGQNLKYPKDAEENGIQGRVFIEFIIDKDGNLTNAKVKRGVDGLLDNEALRVVNSSPKWEPGKQKGQAVNVKFTMPIVFALK